MKGKYISFLLGIVTGATLICGANAADGVMAQLSWQKIFVDGKQVSMTAYNIDGNNYVKLRDIGQAVGINVYWQDGVRIDTGSPYTGEAPAQAQSRVQAQAAQPASQGTIKVSSYKGGTIQAGERSTLLISPYGGDYTVTSQNPSIVSVEQVSGQWVVVANTSGTATITVTDKSGATGTLTLTVTATPTVTQTETAALGAVDLSANMDIRQEMIRLINQTRKANGVAELTVNEALMNAAQDSSTQMFKHHDSEYECKTAMSYGYPHGFGSNLTWFTGCAYADVAQKAVNNWINSPGHFQAMIDPSCDTLGVGVTIEDGVTYCYMFAGDPNSHHPYE